jgi:hypothetical protein
LVISLPGSSPEQQALSSCCLREHLVCIHLWADCK